MVRLATRKTTSRHAHSSLHRRAGIMSKLSARKTQVTKQRMASHAVPSFIAPFKKSMMPMLSELNKLEMHLKKMVKSSKSNKWLLKTDSALQRRFQTLNQQMMKFKTASFAKLNKFSRSASKPTQHAIRQLKSEIETLRKSAKRNLTILNRYAKSRKAKTGWKAHSTISSQLVRSLEVKFHSIQTHAKKSQSHIEQCLKKAKAKTC